MAISPDIRPACGQSVAEPEPAGFLFGCIQQQTSTASIFIKENVTLAKNYSASATPLYIAPYKRIVERITNCAEFDDYVCGSDDVPNGQIPCLAPPTNSFSAGTSSTMSGSGTPVAFNVGAYQNWYVETDRTQSMPECNQGLRGFKNVYASKAWPGYIPLTAGVWGGFDVFGPQCECPYLRTNEPCTTKYSTMTIVATVTDDYVQQIRGDDGTTTACAACGIDCNPRMIFIKSWQDTTSATQVSSISSIGNYSSNCTSASSYNVCGPEGGALHHDIGADSSIPCHRTRWVPTDPTGCCGDESTGSACMQSAATASINYQDNSTGLLAVVGGLTRASIWGLYCDAASIHGGAPDIVDGDLYSGPGPMTCTWNTTHYTSSAGAGAFCVDKTYFTVPHVIATVSPNSLAVSVFGVADWYEPVNCPGAGYSKPWAVLDSYSYTFTPTSLTFTRITTSGITTTGIQTRTSTCVVTLSNPYTLAQVMDEAYALLGYWDMSRDDLYPWRTDSNVNTGPYVHLSGDSGGSGPSAGSCTANYTGSSGIVIGAPGPVGIDKVWSPTHENWCACTEDEEGVECIQFFASTVGAFSSDAPTGVPRTASDWLTAKRANMHPQGAFCLLNHLNNAPGSSCASGADGVLYDDTVWVCKWAEIVTPRPSINFGRPCAVDRLQVSQSMARCVYNADPVTKIVDLDPSGVQLPTELVTFRAWLSGTSLEDGLYTMEYLDSYQYLASEFLYSGSWVDLGPIYDSGTGMMAPLRWQDEGGFIPGICGKDDIDDLTAPNTLSMVTCSLASPFVIFDLEEVRIENASGADDDGNPWDVNGTWGVIAINSSSIALIGSEGITPVNYNGEGLISTPFATDWKWNDSGSKGQFSTIEWQFNDRARLEYLQKQAVHDAAVDGPCDGLIDAPDPYGVSQVACGYDGRLSAVICSTHCLPSTPCSPRVCYIAPPGQDNFPASSSYYAGWVNGSTFDKQFGGAWQSIPVQRITDPFTQLPACPCSYDAELDQYSCDVIWRQDSGGCSEDGDNGFGTLIRYFPMPPTVESICEPPSMPEDPRFPDLPLDTAPALPEGVKLGVANVSDITAEGCPTDKNVVNPPFGDSLAHYDVGSGCEPYFPHIFSAAWIEDQNKENCVCNSGRFAEEYRRQGVVCPDEEET